jgi:Xaa-Pro aminopeptidase
MTFLRVLQEIEGAATVRTVATDALSPSSAQLLPKAFPSAELVDAEPMLRRVRRVKAPAEVEAIRAAVDVAELSLAAALRALAPGVTERQLTGVFMEAMASQGVTTPSGQDVAWTTSRRHPWHRTSRDKPIRDGDLVAFEGGVVLGGYSGELGRTSVAGVHAVEPVLAEQWSELWDRLLAACRVGASMSGLLEAYDTLGLPAPPMPVARGLGLGFDLPLVTHALPGLAAEQHVEAGMVFALTGYVWREGVGALFGQEPILITQSGPQPLSTVPFRDRRSLST